MKSARDNAQEIANAIEANRKARGERITVRLNKWIGKLETEQGEEILNRVTFK